MHVERSVGEQAGEAFEVLGRGSRHDECASTHVSLLNPLEAEGYLSRGRDAADRRRHVVTITRRGEEQLERAAQAQRYCGHYAQLIPFPRNFRARTLAASPTQGTDAEPSKIRNRSDCQQPDARTTVVHGQADRDPACAPPAMSARVGAGRAEPRVALEAGPPGR